MSDDPFEAIKATFFQECEELLADLLPAALRGPLEALAEVGEQFLVGLAIGGRGSHQRRSLSVKSD